MYKQYRCVLTFYLNESSLKEMINCLEDGKVQWPMPKCPQHNTITQRKHLWPWPCRTLWIQTRHRENSRSFDKAPSPVRSRNGTTGYVSRSKPFLVVLSLANNWMMKFFGSGCERDMKHFSGWKNATSMIEMAREQYCQLFRYDSWKISRRLDS